MELTITQTLTRPMSDSRLALEITLGSGVIHHYEISAKPYYDAVKQILLTEKPPHVVLEPVSHPSAFSELEVPSPS